MRTSYLLVREIRQHKLMFAAGLLAVVLSVGIGVGSVQLLRSFDAETEAIILAKQTAVEAAWAKFKNEVRLSMLELGFNLIIMHAQQQLSTPDTETHYLPQQYAATLAAAKLMTINHVLPFIQQRVWWEEQQRWVTLYGTPGEMQINNPAKQNPLVQTIAPGHASLGHGLHASLGLRDGEQFVLLGRLFTVQDCRTAEGFHEDEQIRIPLDEAQQLLDKQGRITGLMAINCVCEDPEGLTKIRQSVAALLPQTQVFEHKGNRVVRAEERSRAAREAEAALDRERQTRAELRASRETFQAILIPLVTTIATLWLALMMWINVHHRRSEIAILRALGWTDRQVFALILGKAVLIGGAGGSLGYAAGYAAVALQVNCASLTYWDAPLLTGSMLGAVLLAALASWLPATLAARLDPAVVLQQE